MKNRLHFLSREREEAHKQFLDDIESIENRNCAKTNIVRRSRQNALNDGSVEAIS